MQNIYLKNSPPAQALIGYNLTISRFFDAQLSNSGRADLGALLDGELKSETTTATAQHLRNTDVQVTDLILVTTVEHSQNGRPMQRSHLQLLRIGSRLTSKKCKKLGRTS